MLSLIALALVPLALTSPLPQTFTFIPCSTGTAFAPTSVSAGPENLTTLSFAGVPNGGLCKFLLDPLPNGGPVNADGTFECASVIQLDLGSLGVAAEDVVVRVCGN